MFKRLKAKSKSLRLEQDRKRKMAEDALESLSVVALQEIAIAALSCGRDGK